jgi:hypothetical protein
MRKAFFYLLPVSPHSQSLAAFGNNRVINVWHFISLPFVSASRLVDALPGIG